MSAPHPTRVSFGQVTVFVIEIERRPTPPPVLIKVPNPYIRHRQDGLASMLEAPTHIGDAIAMMLQWTREMANRSPDLFLPPSSLANDDDDW